MEVGEVVWNIVMRWEYFEKSTVGKQLVSAVDSIAANLFEGLGRYHFKEVKNFAYYSRGSLFETKTWMTKAFNRKLVKEEEFIQVIGRIEEIGKMINGYIKSIGAVSEPDPNYNSPDT
ncbi:MAG: four helix bundle protein [Cyclobacteriaceae bacterium]